MKDANVPVSRIDIPPDGELKFAKTVDKKTIRYAVWPKGDKGFVLFLNGRFSNSRWLVIYVNE